MSLKNKEILSEDWEKVRCPICMEPPHQAILLLCSSHHNGCRPYVCGTGPRHSHCFSRLIICSKRLVCPLCHEKVKDWSLNTPAQHLLNRKVRSCANVTCEFSGTYMELENHVKLVHPSDAGPSEVDPIKQDLWDLEHYLSQLDLGGGELAKPQWFISGSQ